MLTKLIEKVKAPPKAADKDMGIEEIALALNTALREQLKNVKNEARQ